VYNQRVRQNNTNKEFGMDNDLDLALAGIAREFARKMERAQRYASQVQLVQDATGLKLVSPSKIEYASRIQIDRKDLHAIRKVVGRMEMDGKYLPYDFDSTNEVCVEMKPKSEKFNTLTFLYRTPYKAGKCKVVESVSTHKSLVCSI
jgi:hypothetical protein